MINKEIVFQLVDTHLRCLQGMYFSEYLPFRDFTIGLSDLVEDSYYNYIVHRNGSMQEIAEQTLPLFEHRKRALAFYVTPLSSANDVDTLIPKDFAKWATDVWMIIQDPSHLQNYSVPKDISIESVSIAGRDEYVEIFSRAYGSDNPDDPYGNLPVYYRQSLQRSFENNPEDFSKVYLKATVDKSTVGIVCMFYNDQIAGIYGLGTVQAYRRRGVGTSLMKRLFEIASENHNPQIMLQTESGSYVEKWYKQMGFMSVFTGTYYVHS